MIGAGEGYLNPGGLHPMLYQPAAPLTAEALGGVLRAAYAVSLRHGRTLARSQRGMPQQAPLSVVPFPSGWTVPAGGRWWPFVPAEVTALELLTDVILVPNSQSVVEHRLTVTDGTSTDVGEVVQTRVTNAVVTTPNAQPGVPWPGPLVAMRRERIAAVVELANVAPNARLQVFVEQRASGYVGVLHVGLTLRWRAG